MRTRTAWWGLLVLTLVGVSGAFVWETLAHNKWDPDLPTGQAGLPVLGHVPDFNLKDQANRRVSRKDLLGKTWVVDFIYTDCPDQCPMMSRHMKTLQGLVPKEAKVELVSVSVDPENDTPEVMANYAKKHHADTSRWRFLTGKPETIHALMARLKLAAPSQNSETDVIDHSNRLVIVDAKARIRGYYDGTDNKEMQRLIKDLSLFSLETVK